MDAWCGDQVFVAGADPDSAPHVMVLVPGAWVTARTLDDRRRSDRRPMGWARVVASAAGPDLAVVVWIGYRSPGGIGHAAAFGRSARAGVAALVDQVGRWGGRAAGRPHLTVVAHSYGAVLAAMAAPELDLDDLVLLAAPGVRARTVADLGTTARVWAARASTDWIRAVPGVRLGDLGHGPDPAGAGFGARRLPTAGVSGHNGYLRWGSATLRAVAAIATGREPDRAAQ